MKIVNVMTSRTLGGIEQAFLDYNAALRLKGHDVLAVVSSKTKLKGALECQTGVKTLFLPFSRYNYFLIPVLYFKLKQFAPDLIICHSKRAIPIFKLVARMLKIKIAAVAHNSRYKLINKCDVIFSTTAYQKGLFKDKGFPDSKIFVIPNMVVEKRDFKPYPGFQTPPVIGAIGRFDPMKGFPDFIRALGLLKERKIPFKAVLAGSRQEQYPEEDAQICRLIHENRLEDRIELPGWVTNKDDFYAKIDIFVLPSVYEPFGIVLLEAMLRSIPVVSSLAEGPSEIFSKHPEAASLFAKGDYKAMAECLADVLQNPEKAARMAHEGYKLCQNTYSLEAVADVLDDALKTVKNIA